MKKNSVGLMARMALWLQGEIAESRKAVAAAREKAREQELDDVRRKIVRACLEARLSNKGKAQP